MAESFIGLAALEPLGHSGVGVQVTVEIDDVTSPSWRGVIAHARPSEPVVLGDCSVVMLEGARRGFRSVAAVTHGPVRTQLVLVGEGPFEAPRPPEIGVAGDPVTAEMVADVMHYFGVSEAYARDHIALARGEFEETDAHAPANRGE